MGGKGGRYVRLTTLPPSRADCLEIRKPQPPGTHRACPGLYRDCFIFISLRGTYLSPTLKNRHSPTGEKNMCRQLLWNIPERRYSDGVWGYGLDPCGSGQEALLVTARAVTKRRVLQASWATIRFSMETLLCKSVNETDRQTNKQTKSIREFRFSGMLHGVCSNCLPTFRAACRSHSEGSSSPWKHLAKLHICVLLSTIVRVLAKRRLGLIVCT
jgi:hypothetical protein